MTDRTEQAADRQQVNEKQREAAKKQIAEDGEAREKGTDRTERMAKSKPTPTQEENDLAMLGVHIDEHEDDGSGPEPNPFELALESTRRGQQRSGSTEQRHSEQRHSEASSTRSNYATRTLSATPKRE